MANRKKVPNDNADMLPEYDFSNSEQGMFAGKFQVDSRIMVLDPDVAKIYTSQKSANSALRGLAETLKNVNI